MHKIKFEFKPILTGNSLGQSAQTGSYIDLCSWWYEHFSSDINCVSIKISINCNLVNFTRSLESLHIITTVEHLKCFKIILCQSGSMASLIKTNLRCDCVDPFEIDIHSTKYYIFTLISLSMC